MARLKICLLGSFKVELDGQPVTRAFRTEKERALFAYLVMEPGRPVSREALAEFFWPDRPAGKARANLRQALAGLRKAIEGGPGSPRFLIFDEDQVLFDRSSDYWLDIQAFRGLLRAVADHAHPIQSSCRECALKLEAALPLYRGNFLDDFYAASSAEHKEWLASNREQLFRNMLTALKNLSLYYESQHQIEKAIEINRQQVDYDPLDELPRRKLMRLYTLSGMRSLALEQYRITQEVLREQLQVDPSPETTALYEQLKSGGLERKEKTTPRPPALKEKWTSFIGRQAELDRFKACLSNPACRLLSVVGMPGIGKTRLALMVASLYGGQFPDGVWSVSLEHVHTGEALAYAIAEASQLQIDGIGSPQMVLTHAIRGSNALLILDGFEQLVQQTVFLLDLLHAAPQMKILVTSRVRLDYQSACLFSLDGLDYPPDRWDPRAAEYPAVQLFTNRAVQSRANYQVTSQNLPDIVQICQAVGGHPLALELAAANLRKYTTAQLVEQLEQSSLSLATTLQDVPERHRSLQLLFDQVWEMLSEAQRAACWILLDCQGEFERGTAASALGQMGDPEELLSSLVVKSVLQESQGGRYHFPRLFRQYLLDRNKPPAPDKSPRSQKVRVYRTGASDLYDAAGLAHPQLFWDRLQHYLKLSQRHPERFAVAVIDLTQAHLMHTLNEQEQSALLQLTFQRLVSCLRQEDTIAHLGPGEIGCILEFIADVGALTTVTERMRQALDGEADLGSRRIILKVRMASQVLPSGQVSAEELVEQVRQEILDTL